jgi:methionyl-tRNA formyltransferase
VRSRGKKLEASPVKVMALARGLRVLEAKRVDAALLEEITALAPDVICVAAFGALLPDALLALPRLGCVNVHASLLPRWRGAAPVPRAILAGDAEVGVAIMQVVHEMDAGDYALVASVPVGEKGAPELLDELAHAGARLLVEALAQLEAGTLVWHAQDESLVTFAPKLEKSELALDPASTAVMNQRRVQAASEQTPARAIVAGKGMRVLASRVAPDLFAAPGEVALHEGRVALGCSEGALELLEVKPDGKRAMAARDWARGLHGTGDTLVWAKL